MTSACLRGECTRRRASCFCCANFSTFTLDVVYDYPADGSYSLLFIVLYRKNKNTFAVLLGLCGFSTFFGCCFCLSGLRSTFPKWCTLWKCLFCAVTRWILCMGVVYLKNKKKTKQNITKPPNAWFGILFWRATLYLKPCRHYNPQKPAASTRPVVSLSCGLSGMFLWLFFFSPVRICLFHSKRWPGNCD